MAAPTAKAIHGIDVLRFLAALTVMLFHLGYWIGVPTSMGGRITGGNFVFPWVTGTLSLGKMGVETFFVISGFVIAYTAQKATGASFLRGRILRLVPAVWICGTITLLIALTIQDRTPENLMWAWLRSIFFVPIGEKIDGPYWTLPIECSFYFLVFLLIVLKAMQWFELVFLALAGVSFSFCVGIFLIHPELNGLSWDPWFQVFLLVHGGEFAVGIFLWAMFFKGVSVLRLTGLALGLAAGTLEIMNWMVRSEDRMPGVALWALSIAAIVASVHYNDRIDSWLGPRGQSVIRQLGLITYPLYLLHEFVGSVVMRELARHGVSQVACLGIAMISLIGAALIISRYGEPAIRKWLLAPVFDRLGGSRLRGDRHGPI